MFSYDAEGTDQGLVTENEYNLVSFMVQGFHKDYKNIYWIVGRSEEKNGWPGLPGMIPNVSVLTKTLKKLLLLLRPKKLPDDSGDCFFSI